MATTVVAWPDGGGGGNGGVTSPCPDSGGVKPPPLPSSLAAAVAATTAAALLLLLVPPALLPPFLLSPASSSLSSMSSASSRPPEQSGKTRRSCSQSRKYGSRVALVPGIGPVIRLAIDVVPPARLLSGSGVLRFVIRMDMPHTKGCLHARHATSPVAGPISMHRLGPCVNQLC